MGVEKIYRIIEAIADTSARTEKAKLLSELVADDLGRWIVTMTYDPFKTYGVKPPMPDKIEGGDGAVEFRQNLVSGLLNKLARRELTGGAAQTEVYETFQAFDETGRQILWRIMSKDLKAGVGTSTIQQVAPNLIPSFAVMRAQPYEERIIKDWPMKGEFKLDGQRNTFLCKDGSGAFFTRSGKPVPALDFFVPALLEAARKAPELDPDLAHVLWDDNDQPAFMLDGEAMMGLFAETGALRRKDVDARNAELHLYDILPFRDFDAMGSVGDTLNVRREGLVRFVRAAKQILRESDTPDMIQIVPQYFLNDHAAVETFFAQARSKTLASYLARGNKAREQDLLRTTIDKSTGKPQVLEGIMVKDPFGLYDKKKSRGWLKMKAEETEDLRVIGAFPGEPGTKYENCLGGLIVDRAGVHVRVGGGFSDAERIAIWEDWLELIAHAPISELLTPAKRGGHTICAELPETASGLWGRITEIEFHEVTPDGSLRHPRFVRFRDDKDGEIEDKEALTNDAKNERKIA